MKSNILFILSLLMFLISCTRNGNDVGIVYEGIDDPSHIGFWFREKDSIDHNLTEVANVVWRFGRDNYEDIYDLEKVLNWQRECETALVQCFDSLHPGSNLTLSEKADSMASVLSHFLVDNEIETLTMSTLVDWGAEESFNRFRTATMCKKVIEMKPDFEKEIKAYNSFCSKFIEHLHTIAGRWGGSYSAYKCIALTGHMDNARFKDLSDLCIYFENSDYGVSSIFQETAHDMFILSMNLASSKCEIKEDDDYGDWTVQSVEKVKQNKDSVINLFEEWYKIRLALKPELQRPYDDQDYYSFMANLMQSYSVALTDAVNN